MLFDVNTNTVDHVVSSIVLLRNLLAEKVVTLLVYHLNH
jgi:hypothetical protein